MSELARALIDVGVRVEIATLAEEVEVPTMFEGNKLRLQIAPMRGRARARALDAYRQEREGLRRLITQSDANVVHAHWTYEFAWAALDTRRPTVVTARDAPLTILSYSRDRYRAMRTILAYFVRSRIRNLTAVSPYLARAWRRQMLYRREVEVIPNLVSSPKATLGTTMREMAAPTILDVTDNGRRKNVGALIRAMPQVLASHPGARLRLVGPGLTSDGPLAALAERLEVLPAVDFVGPVDFEDLPVEYSGGTVFVHTSLEESFGMSIAEAMAHGLPVIAGARAGGPPWVLDQGRAGLLVDVRRPDAIAETICRLLDDPARRAELGQAAERRIRDSFSPSVVVPRWIKVYERIIQA